jgi:predicted ATPase/class 3 adenylate cyclase
VGAPSGTVTFLFTDIEGSTRLWDESPDAMAAAVARHDRILVDAVSAGGGHVFSTGGDGFGVAFWRSADALTAAVAMQRALAVERWSGSVRLTVRMGLHTGEAEERDGNYFGSVVNRAARIMAAANGGQIVVSDTTAAVLGQVPGVGLIDLGVHRLRGLMEPSRVFGVKADGWDWLDRALATAEPTKGNLQRPATEWFGPAAAVSQRVADLAHCPLVTLTGPGGIGKTRLAVEVGARAADDFPDGVWMVELAPIGDGDAMLGALAATLGVIPQDGWSVRDSIVGWLEERRPLLILDNCEHLLVPMSELVDLITRRLPGTTVLVTSREPLGLAVERVVPVASMTPSDAADLFRDRAAARDATLVFDVSEAGLITDVCRRLDGIPLAIELAAARARSLGVAELRDRLIDRFQLLRHSGRGGLERHQTLRATVGWSYKLLIEPEQLLFDRLSVFPASFDLAAAEAIGAGGPIGDREVVDLLAALVDKSLVMVDRGPYGVRYRLLETLRQYGEEMLEGRDETAQTRTRFLAHYLTVAARVGELFATPRADESMRLFGVEVDNLRAAHAIAVARADVATAEAILEATYGPHSFSARLDHGEWAEATVALAPSCPVSPATYGCVAGSAWRAGEHGRAIDVAREGIAAAEFPDHPSTLLCWAHLVTAAMVGGRFGDALDAVPHLAAVTANEEADPLHRLIAVSVLVIASALGERDSVAGQIARIDAVVAPMQSPALTLLAQFAKAVLLMVVDPPDPDSALALHRSTRYLAEDFGATLLVFSSLTGIAALEAQRCTSSAAVACKEALALAYEARAWSFVWTCLLAAATYFRSQGDLERAATVLGYLDAHEPGALILGKFTRLVDDLEVLDDPSTSAGRDAGKTMDRHALVRSVLDSLPSSIGD